MTTGKTIALTRRNFVGKVMSLLFNMCLGWSWRRQWHLTPVLLPGKSHGRRSLVGCGPWGRWGLDTTERLHFHFSLSWVGEGNGNLLQCSCLENPRDGGASWAAVHGVTQSRTQLKQLSSSSSRLVIACLPRSKCLLISCLQSPSAVILEPPKNKVCHCFHCFPIYLPCSDGTRCHDLCICSSFYMDQSIQPFLEGQMLLLEETKEQDR